MLYIDSTFNIKHFISWDEYFPISQGYIGQIIDGFGLGDWWGENV